MKENTKKKIRGYWLIIRCFIMGGLSAMALLSAKEIISDDMMESFFQNTFINTNGTANQVLCKLAINYSACYSVLGLLLFGILAFLYYYLSGKEKDFSARNRRISIIGGGLYAFLLLCGESINQYGTLDLIFYNKLQLLITICNFVGYAFLFYNVIMLVAWLYQNNSKQRKNVSDSGINQGTSLTKKEYIIKHMLVMMLCWLPWMIVFFPGGVWFDVDWQIGMYRNVTPWTTHHPVFTTFIYGKVIELGEKIFDANVGAFIYNITQAFFAAFVLTYVLEWIYKNVSIKYSKIIFWFFAISPIWPMIFYSMSKDSAYVLGFLVFVFLMMKWRREKRIEKCDYIMYSVAVILILLFRNNGIYLFVLSLPFVLMNIASGKKRWKIIVLSGVLFIGCQCLSMGIVHKYNIHEGQKGEMFSIPLQQTARWAVNYPNEVTEQDKEVINQIVDYDFMVSNYIPDISDNVKGTWKNSATKEDLKAYFRIWIRGLIQHPRTYIEATMANTVGYWSIGVRPYELYVSNYDVKLTGVYNLKDGLDIHQLACFKEAREIISNIGELMVYLPGVGMMISPGFYTWCVCLLTLLMMINRKEEKIISLIPLYINLLICLASPVNSCVRYVLPIMICIPFVLTDFLTAKEESGERINAE